MSGHGRSEPSDDEIEAWIKGHLEGDRGCWEQLFRYLEPTVVAAVGKALSQAHKPMMAKEDLVGDLLLRLLKTDLRVLERWEPSRGSLKGLVFKVAQLRAKRLIHTCKWSPLSFFCSEVPARAGQPAQAEQLMEDNKRMCLLYQALLRLSATDRELYRLAYSEELNTDEIGVVLGLSRDAVHQRLSRMRQKLTKLIH